MEDWFELTFTVPLFGRQHAGWLWTDIVRAQAIAASLKGCLGGGYEVLDKHGQPLALPVIPFPGFKIPNLGGGFFK